MNMHADIKHWTTLVPPATPSDADVATYERLIIGPTVLLLGSTKPLLKLATVAYDLCPKYNDPKIVDRNWLTIDCKFDTIIGDGVFVFGKELSDSLLRLASTHCKRFVVRSFVIPPEPRKYGVTFPQPDEFEIVPTVAESTSKYNFYVWDFE